MNGGVVVSSLSSRIFSLCVTSFFEKDGKDPGKLTNTLCYNTCHLDLEDKRLMSMLSYNDMCVFNYGKPLNKNTPLALSTHMDAWMAFLTAQSSTARCSAE